MIDSYQDVGARLRRGVVTGSTQGGRLLVREDLNERTFTCESLRLSAGPRFDYVDGTEVVFVAADDDEQYGYILGALERPNTEPTSAADVTVVRDGEPAVISLRARQRLELSCGRASLIMNADGTVVLKGTTVVSRASGVNKIRGAAVRIN